MIKFIIYASKYVFLITLGFLLVLSVINISFYFTHFTNKGYFPDVSQTNIYNDFLFWGFKAAPGWVGNWFSNPKTVEPSKFYLLSYLMLGVIYFLLFLYGLFVYIKHRGTAYFVFIAFATYFFLPFSFIISTIFFVNTLIYWFFSSELYKIKFIK